MELRADGYCRKLTDPPGLSYDPLLHECSVIPFSIDLRDTSSLLRRSPPSFAQLAMRCSNPPCIQQQDYRDRITPPGYKNSSTRDSAIAILIFYYLQREIFSYVPYYHSRKV